MPLRKVESRTTWPRLTLQGDTEKPRAAYPDFQTLWEEADPDIPILIQAKAEFAKLL